MNGATLTSAITDIRGVPLAEIDTGGLAATLRRIGGLTADDQRVPIAAFDSSI